LLVAFATASLGLRAVVPPLGDALAHELAVVASAVPGAEEPVTAEIEVAPASEPLSDRGDAGSGGEGGSGHPGPPAQQGKKVEAIDIPADRLARLTAKQLQGISASDAVDAAGHALGARLHGVGGLGVGLGEGDVVTSIDGRAITNADDATVASLGAYASGESTAHATLVRGERAIRVTVHIPAREKAGAAPGRP
jgi:hypothetical protein